MHKNNSLIYSFKKIKNNAHKNYAFKTLKLVLVNNNLQIN